MVVKNNNILSQDILFLRFKNQLWKGTALILNKTINHKKNIIKYEDLTSKKRINNNMLIPLRAWIKKSFMVSLNIILCFKNIKPNKKETVLSSKKNHILNTLELKSPLIILKTIKNTLKNFIDKNKRISFLRISHFWFLKPMHYSAT